MPVDEFLETQDHPLITAVLQRTYGLARGDAPPGGAERGAGLAPLVELLEAPVQWPNRQPYDTYFGTRGAADDDEPLRE